MAPNLAPIDVDELLDDIRRQIGESWHEDEADAVQLHLRDVKLQSSSDTSFNEDDYLCSNPDVSVAVQRGDYESGYAHWLKYGRNEGRTLRGGPLNNGLCFASNPNATVGEPIESGQTKERPEARISNYISRRRELDRELQEQLFEIGTSIKTLGEMLCRRSLEEADLLEALLQAREDRSADDTGPEVNHAEYRND